MKFCAHVTSSRTSSSYLSQPHSSHTSINLPSVNSSGFVSSVLMCAGSSFPMVGYFIRNSIYIQLEFHFLYHRFFFTALSTHHSIPFSITHFYRLSQAYNWEAEKQHNYVLCRLCVNRLKDAQWPVSDKL